MTHPLTTEDHPRPARRRSAAKLAWALAIGCALGAGLVATGVAQADTAAPNTPSYDLGFTKAFNDGQLTATRMRAEGFSLQHIVVSNRIPTICAKEAASVQAFPGLDRPEFMQGCADGMNSLIETGVAY
ncbi:hypothetical protein [Mycobacterium angelicum]|uniref:Uncharacterized protein n=1 Tax=Mycobacterium angelicum TaxID=470074 RepID=A0A1W9ZKP7_MYCAN|nr:hypothetical protein [Mycobacterium angelicum]MCV7199854.1 hypothetical protein [Mycobacterium angelicum]ORA17285.1 hypothetical protein BST12_19615 [Mycobacterium angelicum]